MRDLLRETADLAADFLESLPDRPVFPPVELDELRARLAGPIPEEPIDSREVVTELAATGGDAAVAMPSGRYFGFVIGGALPAALATDWLAAAWDQNAGLYVGGPAASVVEEVAGTWLAELLRLPAEASFAFVTGTQMAHVTALAAARHHVLAAAGWDVEHDGLAGAPRIRVVAGAKRHTTINRALRFIGLGTGSILEVPADDQGRMRAADVREALGGGGPTIVCAQAGEVNTGSFDPIGEIADAAGEAGGWLHVDGAFGLWAATSPRFEHLTAGAERADSWSVDGHKWLNVPYDSGIVFCAHPDAHRAAMTTTAEYLIQAEPGAARDQVDWTPEFSRRARGFCRLRGDPIPRPPRDRGADRALLRPCPALRGRARSSARCGDPQRSRPQPSAVPLRDGPANGGRPPGRAGERGGVDERNHLARKASDPHLGEQLADDGGRRRPDCCCVRASRARWFLDQVHVQAHARPGIGRLDLDGLAELARDPQTASARVGGIGREEACVGVGDAGATVFDFADELVPVVPDPDGAASSSVGDRVHRHLVRGQHDLGDPPGRQAGCGRRRPDELPDVDQALLEVEKLDTPRLG
jgi:hypothetical protein